MVIMYYPRALYGGMPHKTKARMSHAGLHAKPGKSSLVLGLQNFATTIEASGADVVTQVGFTRGGLNGDTGHAQSVVRAVHAALGRRFFVLLDGHDRLLVKGLDNSATNSIL
jgi:hypothetical protein